MRLKVHQFCWIAPVYFDDRFLIVGLISSGGGGYYMGMILVVTTNGNV
jgi:hypothetical protein